MPHKKPVWSFNVKISPSERLNVSAVKSLCAASGSTAMCMFTNRRLKPSKSMQQMSRHYSCTCRYLTDTNTIHKPYQPTTYGPTTMCLTMADPWAKCNWRQTLQDDVKLTSDETRKLHNSSTHQWHSTKQSPYMSWSNDTITTVWSQLHMNHTASCTNSLADNQFNAKSDCFTTLLHGNCTLNLK